MGPNGSIIPAEEGGEAALNFSKELCSQRDASQFYPYFHSNFHPYLHLYFHPH